MARRSGNKWYVAGVCSPDGVTKDKKGRVQPLKLELSLPMFDGAVQLYQNNQLTTAKLTKKKTLKVEMPANGGLVITQ